MPYDNNVHDLGLRNRQIKQERKPVPGALADQIDGRDHHSEASYQVAEKNGQLEPYISVPEIHWEQFYTPLNTINVRWHLQPTRGMRPGRAAIGQGKPVTIVHQNPVGPIAPTAKGFESIDKAIRVGTFQAGMNAASYARRRRGQ